MRDKGMNQWRIENDVFISTFVDIAMVIINIINKVFYEKNALGTFH